MGRKARKSTKTVDEKGTTKADFKDIDHVETIAMVPGEMGAVAIARHDSEPDMASIAKWIDAGLEGDHLTVGGAQILMRMFAKFPRLTPP